MPLQLDYYYGVTWEEMGLKPDIWELDDQGES